MKPVEPNPGRHQPYGDSTAEAPAKDRGLQQEPTCPGAGRRWEGTPAWRQPKTGKEGLKGETPRP